MIFSVAQIVNYYWDQESVYGKTIECGGMICEREMSLSGDGKQLKKVMTECPMVENSKERKQLEETNAARRLTLTTPNHPIFDILYCLFSERTTLRLLYAIGRPSVRLLSVCCLWR